MVKNGAVFCNVLDIDSILPFKLLNFTILGRHSSKELVKIIHLSSVFFMRSFSNTSSLTRALLTPTSMCSASNFY